MRMAYICTGNLSNTADPTIPSAALTYPFRFVPHIPPNSNACTRIHYSIIIIKLFNLCRAYAPAVEWQFAHILLNTHGPHPPSPIYTTHKYIDRWDNSLEKICLIFGAASATARSTRFCAMHLFIMILIIEFIVWPTLQWQSVAPAASNRMLYVLCCYSRSPAHPAGCCVRVKTAARWEMHTRVINVP